MQKKIIIFAILILGVCNDFKPLFLKDNTFAQTIFLIERNNVYNVFINSLKASEGLRLKPYLCTAKQNTIGFGHHNIEKLKEITLLQADSILHNDFKFAMGFVHKKTVLTCNCQMALAHFVFAHGTGKFLRASLYSQKLYQNKALLIQELLKWQKTKPAKKARSLEISIIKNCKTH